MGLKSLAIIISFGYMFIDFKYCYKIFTRSVKQRERTLELYSNEMTSIWNVKKFVNIFSMLFLTIFIAAACK